MKLPEKTLNRIRAIKRKEQLESARRAGAQLSRNIKRVVSSANVEKVAKPDVVLGVQG